MVLLSRFHSGEQPRLIPEGLRWLILLRMIIALFALFVVLLIDATQDPGTVPAVVKGLLLGLSLLNVGYLLAARWVRRMEGFVILQLLVDIAVVTALVFFTGGMGSIFLYLYFGPIMGGSSLLTRRKSGLVASVAAVGIALIGALHLTGGGEGLYGPPAAAPAERWRVVWHMLFVVAAFFLVAYLSSLLKSRLLRQQALNEQILESMPEGVMVLDEQDRILFVNNEFLRLFSDRAIRVGDRAGEVFDDPETETLRQALLEGHHNRFEIADVPDEHSDRPPLEIRITPLGEEGARRGLVALFIDLSLRRRVELAERRAERFEAVGEMAAGLAHEIRNPLASMSGSLEEIGREFNEGTPQHRLCEIVRQSSKRLDDIISEFLDFARTRPLRLRRVRLHPLLEEVRELVQRHPLARRVECSLDIRDSEAEIRADGEQVREVFFNLAINACAAMEGEGRLFIAVRFAPPPEGRTSDFGGAEEGVLVTFADTGPGVAAGDVDQIFEPFYTTKPHGTGLGLSIALRVLQAHQGAIWVEDHPGGGARFCCWFPVEGPRGGPVLRREGTGVFRRRQTEL
jgi:two-component system sensor histidine kinase PilS (NtrC family)